MNYNKEAIVLHRRLRGKFSVESKEKVTKENLSLLYTPGVAEPCREIHKDPKLAYDFTARGNLIAVVSDGSAVLGLGNIGPLGAMPVMEGKCILFKEFGGVDAFPICLDTQDTHEIINTIKYLAPSFGGINLEDISAPRCFEIERVLKEELDIPVFHDDQHGTAVVVLAGLINALKLANREVSDTKIVINGAGAAGTAVAKFLLQYGFKNIIVCCRTGIIDENDAIADSKKELARITNPEKIKGNLKNALENADVFIGVSVGNIVSKDMIKAMADDPIIFALANPIPEISPNLAKEAGARIIATGRSDYPNQINNVLAFPGIMKGALDVRAKDITEDMKIAASLAIASLIKPEDLSYNNFIPKAYDLTVGEVVAKAVARKS